MKVLWVSASAIGPAAKILDNQYSGSSGTWIQTIYEEISMNDKPDMFFLSFSKSFKLGEIEKKVATDGTAYRTHMPKISLGRTAPRKLKESVESIITEISPDIIHIWGTETCVQNLVADCAPTIPKIVFMQGTIGIHDRYHNVDVKKYGLVYEKGIIEKFKSKLHDYLFHKQVDFEKKELLIAGNVIIDSKFSQAYCESISSEIRCFYYPLNARKVFSENRWEYCSCTKNTIFTVYGAAQDKGLYQLIRALRIVKTEIPNIMLMIPGPFNISYEKGRLWGSNSYEKFICKLINDYSLVENVTFMGKLSQDDMVSALRKANIFVNPSIMETHALSLREAMTTGTPSISSYCGSVSEYLRDGVNGLLYRYEEYEVLASKIKYLLRNPERCDEFSLAGIDEMKKKSKDTNGLLVKIYSDVICREAN